MSLISEALKKAQRQRTVDAPGGEGPRVVVRRGAGPAPGQILLVAGGLVLVVIAVAVFVVIKLRPSEEEIAARIALAAAKAPTAPAVRTNTTAPAGPSPGPGAAPVAAAPAATPPPLIVLNVPPAGGTAAAAAPIPIAPAPERPALVTPAAAVPAAARGSAPAGGLQDYVETLRVTGWSAAGAPADRKVMINERVYRINDLVDRALGLRLTEIQSDRLIFSDERGGTFVRRL